MDKLAGYRKNGPSWWIILTVVLLVAIGYQATAPNKHFSSDCIKIGGGGYSGFYYMHGILAQHHFVVATGQRDLLCYSAGCLNAVALWSNYSIDQVIDFGNEAQQRYLLGQMPWVGATDRMVHNLIHGHGLAVPATVRASQQQEGENGVTESALQHLIRTNPNFLSSLHIITTTFTAWGWPTMVIRTPETVDELQEMLMQTSWIPFATGDGWIKNGHLDGGFSILSHPTCPTTICISLDWQILFNVVNVLMPSPMLRELSRKGQQLQLTIL